MNITDIRVKRISTPGKMRAVASITFDDMFVVHDIKIIEGQSGLFIAMPSKKCPMANIRMLHIRSIRRLGKRFRQKF